MPHERRDSCILNAVEHVFVSSLWRHYSRPTIIQILTVFQYLSLYVLTYFLLHPFNYLLKLHNGLSIDILGFEHLNC